MHITDAYPTIAPIYMYFMVELERKEEVTIWDMSIDYLISLIRRAKLVSAVIFLQSAYAGLSIICASAMNQGMKLHTFVYRMAIATVILSPFALYFDRITRPKMTFSIIAKVMLLNLFDPVLNQNPFYLGMKLSSPTFTTAMSNITPALAFLIAWIFRLEKVSFTSLQSLAKVLGTMITICGAVTSTLVKGPSFSLPWAKEQHHHRLHQQSQSHSDHKDFVKGAIVIIANGVSLSSFIVLNGGETSMCTQTFTLRSYPCQLSLAALICFSGMVEAAVLALVLEWRNSAAWSIQLDTKLLAAACGGLLSVAVYWLMGTVVKQKGPVFYSAFNPLGTVTVAILGALVLAEQLYLGSLIGAIVIFIGLYMVLWGKTKDQLPSKSQSQPLNNEVLPKAGV